MRRAIFVNGVPASGKSTVTSLLTAYLVEAGIAVVPLSVDTVKEVLFAHIGSGDREHNRMLGYASYHGIFASMAAFPDNLVPVVDAWHGFQAREAARQNIKRAGIDRVIEVWCAVSPETAAARYRSRADTRHPGHLPASYADELRDLTARARPLALGTVIRVDTQQQVTREDLTEVLEHLDDALNGCV